MVDENKPKGAMNMVDQNKPKGDMCPECGSGKIKYDHIRGESVCEHCGAVINESMIDLTQEWRAFDEDQRSRRVRTGAVLTPTKHDQGLTTEIGKGRGELFKVASKKRAQYYRLTKWHKRLIKSKDRNLSFAFSELQRLVSYLHLSKAVHEKVAKLYQQAVEKGLVRGRSTESIIAALLYTTCREEGAPRTLDEISNASGINKKDIGKTYRYIARKLSIRILPAKSKDYVPRFGSLLNLSEKVQVRAVEILNEASKYDVTSGKGPIGVAAAALYISAVLAGEKKTQREVADIIGVTEVTIRNRYKEIVDALDIRDEVEEKVKEDDSSDVEEEEPVIEERSRNVQTKPAINKKVEKKATPKAKPKAKNKATKNPKSKPVKKTKPVKKDNSSKKTNKKK